MRKEGREERRERKGNDGRRKEKTRKEEIRTALKEGRKEGRIREE